MPKPLVWMAAVAYGLALIVSVSVNAAFASTSGRNEGDNRSINETLQQPSTTVEMKEGQAQPLYRFPLMLPRPTSIDRQDNFDLG